MSKLVPPNAHQLKIKSIPVTDFGQPDGFTDEDRRVMSAGGLPTTQEIIRDMLGVMTAYHGIGLSAIQIGIPLQLITIDIGVVRDGKKPGIEYLCMVNPTIIKFSKDAIFDTEGCLSFPDFYQSVARPSAIYIKYLNPENNFAEEQCRFEGLSARTILHEMDHLDGKTIFEKASSMKRNRYLNNLRKGK